MKNKNIERMTAQKKYVLDYLKSVCCHPSAEKVYSEVKKKLPTISQATVYRILNNLKNKNEIQGISTKEITYYDGDMRDHGHFICNKCKKVYDIFDICSNCDILKNKRTKVGKINNYKIQFYGICKKCDK